MGLAADQPVKATSGLPNAIAQADQEEAGKYDHLQHDEKDLAPAESKSDVLAWLAVAEQDQAIERHTDNCEDDDLDDPFDEVIGRGDRLPGSRRAVDGKPIEHRFGCEILNDRDDEEGEPGEADHRRDFAEKEAVGCRNCRENRQICNHALSPSQPKCREPRPMRNARTIQGCRSRAARPARRFLLRATSL